MMSRIAPCARALQAGLRQPSAALRLRQPLASIPAFSRASSGAASADVQAKLRLIEQAHEVDLNLLREQLKRAKKAQREAEASLGAALEQIAGAGTSAASAAVGDDSLPRCLVMITPEAGNVPKPWGGEIEGPTWNWEYPCEFRQSQIPNAGRGTFALVDIPAGIQIRRVACADGTLLRIGSEASMLATGWDVPDTVNYGIGHWKDPSSIYFLNPGTAMNHADKSRVASVKYNHDEAGVLTLWTTCAIKAGEEMFIDYGDAFGPCPWFDKLHNDLGQTPLCQLAALIDGGN